MYDSYDEIIESIKKIEIQGAVNVMKYGLKALLLKLKDSKNILKDFKIYSNEIAWIRPTEPLLRNGLYFINSQIDETTTYEDISKLVDKYIKFVDEANEVIKEVGSNIIKDGETYMTICHSSTVMNIFKKAYDQGKDFKVITCETRPLFQGRKSARELNEYGIEVLYIVDSAMAKYLNKVDSVIVGADSINSNGVVVNKIGSLPLAICSKYEGVDFVVAAILLKYDILSRFKGETPIEYRDPKEVWVDAPETIKIENPAFDYIDQHLIDYLITEQGIISPYNVVLMVSKKYPWLY